MQTTTKTRKSDAKKEILKQKHWTSAAAFLYDRMCMEIEGIEAHHTTKRKAEKKSQHSALSMAKKYRERENVEMPRENVYEKIFHEHIGTYSTICVLCAVK